jgi:hypothetical protein
MRGLVTLACTAIPEADVASVSMRSDHGTLATPWASADVARQLDKDQYELGHGPCVEAVRSGSPCHVLFTESDLPWPELALRWKPHDVGAVLSVPVRRQTVVRGALNLYSRRRQLFSEEGQRLGARISELIASVLALIEQMPEQRLVEAVSARDVIAAAEGVVMAWQGSAREEAFATLRRTAVRDRRRLVDVAQDVLASASQHPA